MTEKAGKSASALRFIVCLGIVSLFADMTYEGAHSIIGPYLNELGATALEVAAIAGIGEMLGASLRFFSGRFADKTHAYWTITMCGYAMNVVAVPALAFAHNWHMAAILIIAERTGESAAWSGARCPSFRCDTGSGSWLGIRAALDYGSDGSCHRAVAYGCGGDADTPFRSTISVAGVSGGWNHVGAADSSGIES